MRIPPSIPSPSRVVRFGLGLALVLVLALAALAPADALAASPSPGASDTRSSGEGAGFVGQPVLAALGVVVLGAVAAGATILYVRARRPA
ncbi:MAG: hypothetical protein ACXVAE_02925 [Candidatus Limnocylindrales bacterium]